MKFVLLAFTGILILGTASCGRSPDPLTVDLEPLLVQEGDLPSGVRPSQVRAKAPDMFSNLPSPQRTVARGFERNGETCGGVTLFIYTDREARRIVLEQIEKSFGSGQADSGIKVTRHAVPGVGDICTASVMDINIGALALHVENIDLVFRRCSAIAHIRLGGTKELDDAVNYATRLDSRLQTAICE